MCRTNTFRLHFHLQLSDTKGIWSRDLHGITDRGNRGITAVKTAVMGNGSGGNGDSCLEISIDYRDKTAVTAVMGTILVVLPW